MLDGEHVTVEVGYPTPPLDREVEETHRVPDERLDPAPEERRVPLREVGRAGVAELVGEADLGELVEQRVQLARVERIAELPDQVGRPQQAGFRPGLPVLVVRGHGEPHPTAVGSARTIEPALPMEASRASRAG